MAKVWVIRNRRKIGTSGMTDSFTPRRFIIISRNTPSIATTSLYGSQPMGRKLKMASAPLAIEMVMVRT